MNRNAIVTGVLTTLDVTARPLHMPLNMTVI